VRLADDEIAVPVAVDVADAREARAEVRLREVNFDRVRGRLRARGRDHAGDGGKGEESALEDLHGRMRQSCREQSSVEGSAECAPRPAS
jgi:hypothetical protein